MTRIRRMALLFGVTIVPAVAILVLARSPGIRLALPALLIATVGLSIVGSTFAAHQKGPRVWTRHPSGPRPMRVPAAQPHVKPVELAARGGGPRIQQGRPVIVGRPVRG